MRAKRGFLGLPLVLVLLITAACGGEGGDDSGANGDMLHMTYVQQSPSLAYLPGWIAESAGFFEDEGLDLEMLAPTSDSLTLVMNGGADIGTASSPQMFNAVAEGRAVVALGTMTPASTNELVLSTDTVKKLASEGVTPDSPIGDRVEALRGMTLTVPPEGTSSNLALQSTLREYGLDPAKDVKLIPVADPIANVTTTREGRADGYMHSPPVTSEAVAQGFGEVWFSYFKGDVPIMKNIHLIEIVANKGWLADNEEATRRYLKAIWRAFDLLEKDPEAAAKAVRERYKNTDDKAFKLAFDSVREAYLAGPIPTEANFEKTRVLIEEQLDRPLKISFGDVYDLDLIKHTKP